MKEYQNEPNLVETEGSDNQQESVLLKKLKEAESNSERQDILNQLFSLELKDKKLMEASLDKLGRRVIYYRYMPFDKLINILESGKQNYFDYCPNELANLDEEDVADLKSFLKNYKEFKEGSLLDLDYCKKDLETIFTDIFTEMKQDDIRDLLTNLNYKNLMNFIINNIDKDYLKIVHTGSLYQKFSPYLSMSVGGPICSISKQCYVEMVIPDSKIELHPKGVQGEKEVLIEEISKEFITRVYFMDQLFSEVIENPNTVLGGFVSNHEDDMMRTAIETWRWDQKTEDCLPVGLLE